MSVSPPNLNLSSGSHKIRFVTPRIIIGRCLKNFWRCYVLVACAGWICPVAFAQPVQQRIYISIRSSSRPFSALTQTPDGSLWGTVESDALFSAGYVFRVIPPPRGVISIAAPGSGANPTSGLLLGQDGNL